MKCHVQRIFRINSSISVCIFPPAQCTCQQFLEARCPGGWWPLTAASSCSWLDPGAGQRRSRRQSRRWSWWGSRGSPCSQERSSCPWGAPAWRRPQFCTTRACLYPDLFIRRHQWMREYVMSFAHQSSSWAPCDRPSRSWMTSDSRHDPPEGRRSRSRWDRSIFPWSPG